MCIIAPTRHLIEKVYPAALNKNGIEFQIITRDEEMLETPGARLCTMHRAKGLE
jgi:hypothetical protein